MSPPGPGSQTAKRPAPMRDGPLRRRRRLTRGVSAARSVQRIATGLLGALGGADGQLDALTDGGVDVLPVRSEEHTSELQSRGHLVCRLLLEKKKKRTTLTVSAKRSTWSRSR